MVVISLVQGSKSFGQIPSLSVILPWSHKTCLLVGCDKLMHARWSCTKWCRRSVNLLNPVVTWHNTAQNYLTSQTAKTELVELMAILLELLNRIQQIFIFTCRLSSCGITKEACAFLTSALSSKPCQLKKLDLSDNRLWDLGVGMFSDLLENPNCNLEELR